MSGHNKWSSIKHKKGAADAKRGKIFSRLAKEITLSARAGGGDPALNPRLRSAVMAAKSANMPNDNVDRAIKKGTGELAGGVLEELHYEGYAPGGVALIVTCLSDNRNRTAAEIRAHFTRSNSTLAGTGAVSYMFQRKARFIVDDDKADEEKLLELLIEQGVDVDDVKETADGVLVLAAAELFGDVVAALEAAELTVAESSLAMVPDTAVPVTDAGVARQIQRLIDALEDDDDVQEVFSNAEFAPEVQEQLASE